jgi:hypothetical protein
VTDISLDLIAPCGMNCGICGAYLRDKNKCDGCNSQTLQKANHCLSCSIKFCKEKTEESSFCYCCNKFPCAKLKHLDKRYREKYGMSEIDNLNKIKAIGLVEFMKIENTRWVCPDCGKQICVHNKKCYFCKKIRL